MGWRWGGENQATADKRQAATSLLVLIVGGFIGAAVADALDRDEVIARADIEAAVIVDAAVVEMRGYGADGQPGVFLYDCRHVEGAKKGEPTLVCEQREEAVGDG